MLAFGSRMFPTRLEYNAGLDNAPGDPFGRTELAIEADGSATLVHKRMGQTKRWTAKVDAATLAAAWAALVKGGWPTVPQHPIPGGSAMRTLIAHTAEGTQRGDVAWNGAKNLDGYNEAFPILDSIVRQISQDTVKATPNTLPPVVTDIVCETTN